MLDLQRLAVLVRFGQLGSITATADAMGYSPSAVSQQLATLERETQTTLLERTARSARLSDDGQRLAAHARELLALAERTEAALQGRTGAIGGRLVVSAIPSLAPRVATALAQVQARHPGLELLMREADGVGAPGALEHHLVDLAIVDDWEPRGRRRTGTLATREIGTDPVLLAVPDGHPLGAEPGPIGRRALADAAPGLTWLCAPEGHLSRVATDRRLAELGAVPGRRWEFEGLRTLAELVAAGAGCALLPRSVVGGHAVTARALAPALSRRVLALTRAAAQTAPALAVCRDAVVEHLSDLGSCAP